MIQVNHLEKSFEGFHALKGVDMHVEKGAIYGLVGPNGAGKSTLIRHITGVYKPDAGEVLIAGEPVYENKKVKAKFSYIPDEIFYFMQADTMEMKRFYQGIYPTFDEKLFYRLQEFFPNIDVKRSIRRLSKGMQKQVAFWLAICAKPELMIDHIILFLCKRNVSDIITLIICIKPDTERHYHDQIAQVYDPDRPVMCKILFKYRCIKRGCL